MWITNDSLNYQSQRHKLLSEKYSVVRSEDEDVISNQYCLKDNWCFPDEKNSDSKNGVSEMYILEGGFLMVTLPSSYLSKTSYYIMFVHPKFCEYKE